MAISRANAFRIDFLVMISRGFTSWFTIFNIFSPACFTSSRRPSSTARIEPFPGNAMPNASIRQFIEFAVNIPEQEPQVGHPSFSISVNSCSEIIPASTLPTPSNTEIKSTFFPSTSPAFIGPPETKTVGIFIRTAPISMPGTILSQLVMHKSPSKRWASATVSTESAINSRLGNEYRMPICPMAIPSSTPMVLNSNGTPPASRIACLAILPNSCRWTCPGIRSV